jgi:hypothetical protein
MKTLRKLMLLNIVGLALVCISSSVSAAPKASPSQITFDSFTGIYHLSRDSKGLSLLTTEETILADFPGDNSFYGITRTLPEEFQSHSLNIKVLNVSDAAGNETPYKTSKDARGNLVITTGDPNIILYGFQTIKIRYQTTGVVNLGKKTDEFLLNVNGRGWDQPFSKVNATLYVPSSFGANLKSNPACYTVLGTTSNSNCIVNTKKNAQETMITASASPLAAHQALVVKLQFKPSTFTNKHAVSTRKLLLISAVIIFGGMIALFSYLRKSGLKGRKL